MSRVLVTGATGFIGGQTLPRLTAAGWQVHAVSTRPAPVEAPGVTWHRADLLDPAQIDALLDRVTPDALMHFAWDVSPGYLTDISRNLAWLRASLALVQGFRDRGGRRFVGAGSCLEYDWNHGYCAEGRTPCAPHTIYGTSKHALQMVLSSASSGGFSAAWGRMFFLYGPRERPERLVASVARSLLAGDAARCSHGTQIRDYLYVEDVADAFVALLASDLSGPVNIGSGQPIALKDLVTRLGTLVGRPELIQLGAIPQAPTDLPFVLADTTRLNTVLGWTPRYDLDAGLRKTIAWWQTQGAAAVSPS